MFSTSGDVQYIGGYHDECGEIPWVHRGMFSTSEGYHKYIGGISWVHRGCSVHRRDIMIHVGEPLDKILSISIENSDVLNIPWCTHDIPLIYSWYPPNVLMVSPRCTEHPPCTHGIPHMYHDIPRCTEHPPMYSWYPPDVLMLSPDVLMVSLRCTEHPRMYSWYPPDVLMVSPQCTEHPPMY